jgi:hypothetical protein
MPQASGWRAGKSAVCGFYEFVRQSNHTPSHDPHDQHRKPKLPEHHATPPLIGVVVEACVTLALDRTDERRVPTLFADRVCSQEGLSLQAIAYGYAPMSL